MLPALQGYGTVRFTTTDAAQAAIDKFNEVGQGPDCFACFDDYCCCR